MSNLKKTCTLVVELFESDGRTDMTKVVVVFCNLAKARSIIVTNKECVKLRFATVLLVT